MIQYDFQGFVPFAGIVGFGASTYDLLGTQLPTPRHMGTCMHTVARPTRYIPPRITGHTLEFKFSTPMSELDRAAAYPHGGIRAERSRYL